MSHSSIRPSLTSFETKCTVVASALETRLLRHEPGFESACLASTEFMRRADVALLDVQQARAAVPWCKVPMLGYLS